MELLSSINNSGIGAQYAISAAKDVNGNEITSTYLTAHQSLPNSANWNATYNTVNGNSATWNSTYDTVHDNSASWTGGGGASVTSPRGTINVNGDEIEGTNSAVLTGTAGGYETYLYAYNNNIQTIPSVLTNNSISVTSQTGGTLVLNLQGSDPSLYITVTGQTSGGSTATANGHGSAGSSLIYIPLGEMIGPFTAQATYWTNLASTTLTASAAPITGITGVGELAWNSALTPIRSTSATWNSTYDTVHDNSASWGGGSTYTGDAQGALDEVYTNSGDWNTVTDKLNTTAFSTVSGDFLTAHQTLANSANWDSTYTTVSNNSATWATVTDKLDATAQVVTSVTTGKVSSTGVSAINSTPIISTAVNNAGKMLVGSSDPGMYLTGTHGTAYYKANELIINRTGYGEQIKFNLGSAGSQIIGSAAGNRGAFINMSNDSHTAFVGVLSGEDAAIVLDGASATPNSITSWNGVVSTVSDNSASWGGGASYTGDAQGALDEVYTNSGTWNDTTNTVNTNSGAWGGDALPISAGPGVKVELTDGKLLFSTDETVLYSGSSANPTLSESIDNFEHIKVTYTYWDGNYATKLIYGWSAKPTFTDGWFNAGGGTGGIFITRLTANDSHTVIGADANKYWNPPTGTALNDALSNFKVLEVIGVNRTAGGN